MNEFLLNMQKVLRLKGFISVGGEFAFSIILFIKIIFKSFTILQLNNFILHIIMIIYEIIHIF